MHSMFGALGRIFQIVELLKIGQVLQVRHCTQLRGVVHRGNVMSWRRLRRTSAVRVHSLRVMVATSGPLQTDRGGFILCHTLSPGSVIMSWPMTIALYRTMRSATMDGGYSTEHNYFETVHIWNGYWYTDNRFGNVF